MKIAYDYDTESDVMYISFGLPKPCKTTDVEGVLIRKTLEGVLNGITIIDFSRKTYGKPAPKGAGNGQEKPQPKPGMTLNESLKPQRP